VWRADARSRLGGLVLSGEGAYQAQRAAREAIEETQAVEFPVPLGFVMELVMAWKTVVGFQDLQNPGGNLLCLIVAPLRSVALTRRV
jgi:hypothetical protein